MKKINIFVAKIATFDGRTKCTDVFKMTANIENAQKSNRGHDVNR